jgi:hypothetical protein
MLSKEEYLEKFKVKHRAKNKVTRKLKPLTSTATANIKQRPTPTQTNIILMLEVCVPQLLIHNTCPAFNQKIYIRHTKRSKNTV